MIKTFTRIAIAASLTGAVMAPASNALAASQTERAIIGAVLGGAAGAALSRGDTKAVVVGAAAGAALGAVTHRDRRHQHRYSQRDDRYGYGDSRYDSAPSGGYDRYDSRYDSRYDDRYDDHDRSNRYSYSYWR